MSERLSSTGEHGESHNASYITPADREWMEELGCPWPEPSDEPAWLAEVDKIVALGSQGIDPAVTEAERLEIVSARETFLEMLPAITPGLETLPFSRKETLVPLDTMIDTMRLLYAHGINIADIANKHIQALSYSPAPVQRKLQSMYAFARAWGWADYETHVNRLVMKMPSLLSNKTGKLRTLAQIATRTFTPLAPSEVSTSDLLTMLYKPLERLLVAYIERGEVIRSPRGLVYQSRRYHDWTTKERQGYILQYPDDPAVKAYLRTYPISDPEACIDAYNRRLRLQQEMAPTFDLDWEGPELMGEQEDIFHAYRDVIGSPELTDAEKEQLNDKITQGIKAAARLAEADEASIDPDERAQLEADIAASMHARRVLIARNLNIAVNLVLRKGVLDRAERVSQGNEALVEFIVNEYVPKPGIDVTDIATERVRVALRHRMDAA